MTDIDTREGFVYFIQSYRGGDVKVGWSEDPVARLRALQVGHPDRLVLIGVRHGTVGLEPKVHDYLASSRVRGEWFRPCDRMRDLLTRAESALPLLAARSRGLTEKHRTSPWTRTAQKRRDRMLRQFCQDEERCLQMLRVKRGLADDFEERWRLRNRKKPARTVNHRSGRYHHWASPDSFRREVS